MWIILSFSRNPTRRCSPNGGGIIHHRVTQALDYEGELTVVIGRGGINIEKGDVYDHVFGYTNGNDTPARDR